MAEATALRRNPLRLASYFFWFKTYLLIDGEPVLSRKPEVNIDKPAELQPLTFLGGRRRLQISVLSILVS